MANAPSRVVELVETFGLHIEAYRSQQYNETQLRREFIDPFFEELGWDVTNIQGYAHAYKDVIHEDAVKVGGATKAPDYSFRIGGVRKFFLEAKKPSVDIKGDPHPAYQLRRYAWSAKLPLSVLTDFEEFAVYDCRIRPRQTDRADAARIMFLTYKDYLKKWDKIAEIFSKEAILKGSFDKFAAATKGKRGTSTVDNEFLAEIEKWRAMLARIIALRNRALSVGEINFGVQRTIDRILFLRMCEDRGIEPYGQLQSVSSGDRTYPRLCEIFEKADQRYNSGLFHFHDEPNRAEPPDELTPNLFIDDKDLKWILHSLYYPQSPYEFSVLPAEILGNVYEQFLGKVITLTPGHRANIEDKPEVKKAGGVYYTPSYIVDYIVKNTVGRLLGDPVIPSAAEESIQTSHCEQAERACPERSRMGRRSNLKPLTPRQVSNIKILDPACGSGSFLIGAYQYLLDWHLKYYTENDPEKHAKGRNPKIFETNSVRHCEEPFDYAQGKLRDEAISNYRLTITEKKRILLNNIFGVDIDSQAVEVTKLSLLLKVLEGESSETLENQYRLFHERALPDLASNIKCGNSLIGPDFFDDLDTSLRDPTSSGRGNLEELQRRINAFDWKAEFPQIFSGKNPGFDTVIGNPPYVRIQSLKVTQPEAIPYFARKYCSASKGNYDVYVVFVEDGLGLLNNKGRLGFILPHKFFNAQYGRPLRELLAKGQNLSHIVHFGHQQVFTGATTYTCLLFLDSSASKKCYFAKVDNLEEWRSTGKVIGGEIPAEEISGAEWNFVVGKGATLFTKLKTSLAKLGDVADMFVGLQTSADDVFIMDFVSKRPEAIRLTSKALDAELILEHNLLFPLVSGTDVNRYCSLPERQYILFPYEVEGTSVRLLDFDTISEDYPKTAAYLVQNKERLQAREKGKVKGPRWYGYIYLKNMARQSCTKLCVPRLVTNLYAAYDQEGTHFLDNVDVGGITLKPEYQHQGLKYLLCLLNSRLLRWYFPLVSAPFRGGWLSANRQFLSQLPIRTIDFHDPEEAAKHDRVERLVDRMLDLHRQLAAAKIPDERTRIQRQIDATDRQIDNLVYGLYDLTDEEIKIVEGAS